MTLDEKLLAAALERREALEAAQDEVERLRGHFVRSVRHLFVAGGSLREIAEALGLSHQRVHQIVEGADPVPAGEAESGETLDCTFCDRNQKQVKKLIAGPGVYICGGCVTETRSSAGAFAQVEHAGITCSFCGKKRSRLEWMVQRPEGAKPTICNECVGLCDDILAEEAKES